jgi:hypothetical protein
MWATSTTKEKGFNRYPSAPGVERLGLVPLPVLRGQHEDRRPHARFPEAAAHRVAAHPGQHDVQHDHVVGHLGGHPQALIAGRGDGDGKSLRLQPALHRRRQPRFVVDYQHSHVLTRFLSSALIDGECARST